jgi:hypothetical protein
MAALKTIDLKIADLTLDMKNPRMPEQFSEMDAFEAILKNQGRKLIALAEDIAEYGLSPVDRMMVIEDKKSNRYYSLEGNRRTAALRLLNTPNLVDDLDVPTSIKKRIKEIASKFDPESVEPISAVEMPNRESARRWIRLRHNGENDGRGIVDWTGFQSGRFENTQAFQLLEFAKEKLGLPEGTVTETFPITTFERLIESPTVRDAIGLDLSGGQLFFTRPISQVKKPLTKIITDLGQKLIKVDKVKTVEHQKEYLATFSKDELPAGDKLKKPQSLADAAKIQPAKPMPASKPKGPLERINIVPKEVNYMITPEKPQQAFYELKRLNVDRLPLSGAIMLRLFVELTVDHYLNKHGGGIYLKDASGKHVKDGGGQLIAKKLKTRITETIDGLKASHPAEKQKLNSALKFLTNKERVFSIQALHEYTHNNYTIPDSKDLKIIWTNSQGLFDLVWG